MQALQAQGLLGLMASTTAVVQHARLKMRLLQAWYLSLYNPLLDPPAKLVTVTAELAAQLTWWAFHPNLLIGRYFGPLTPEIQVTTDASPTGLSAHIEQLTAHGLWSQEESCMHINFLELLVIYKTFQAFERVLCSRVVQVASDNTTTVFYLNKQDGTHSLHLLYLSIQIGSGATAATSSQ